MLLRPGFGGIIGICSAVAIDILCCCAMALQVQQDL